MEELEKLYEVLTRDGYYTKTFEEFQVQAEDPEYQDKVFQVVTREGLFTKSKEDFVNKYFQKKKDVSEPIVQEQESGSVTEQEQVVPGSVDSSPQPTPTEQTTPPTEEVEEQIVEESTFDFGLDQDEEKILREAQIVGEESTAIERAFGKNEITDFFGDLYRAAETGRAQGQSVDDALVLFGKGGGVTDAEIDSFIQANNRLAAQGPSDEMKDFDRIYEEAGGGVFGFFKGLLFNPSVAPQLFTSSVRAMVNPASLKAAGGVTAGFTGVGALGGGLVGAGAGAVTSIPYAIGAAGATLETGLSFAEFLQEELKNKNLDFTRKNVRDVLNDPEALKRIRVKSAGRGAIIGLVDRYSAGLGGKIVAKQAVKGAGKSKRILTAAGIDAAGGSVGEAGARAAVGQEMDIKEIGFEGIAGTSKTPLTLGYAALKTPVYKINGSPVDKQTMLDVINGDDAAFAGSEIEIKNDSDLKQAATKRKNKLKARNEVVKDLLASITENPEFAAGDPDILNQIVELETQLKEIENNPAKTTLGKTQQEQRKTEIKNKINQLSEDVLAEIKEVEVTDQEARESLEADNELNLQLQSRGLPNTGQQIIDNAAIQERKNKLIKEKRDARKKQSPVEKTGEVQSETTEEVVEGLSDQVQRTTREGDQKSETETETKTEEEVEEGEVQIRYGEETQEDLMAELDFENTNETREGPVPKNLAFFGPKNRSNTYNEEGTRNKYTARITPKNPLIVPKKEVWTVEKIKDILSKGHDAIIVRDKNLGDIETIPLKKDIITLIKEETDTKTDTQTDVRTQEDIQTESRDLEAFMNENDLTTDDTVVDDINVESSVTNQNETVSGVQVNENLSVTETVNDQQDNYYQSDQFKSDNANTTVEQHENRIIKLVEKTAAAINKILPEVKIVVHRSQDTYKNFADNPDSRGTFDPPSNTIHINLPKAKTTTAAHEAFHALLFNKYGTDLKIGEATKKMVDSLKKSIKNKDLLKKLDDFSNQYTDFQNEEYVSELLGLLVENFDILDTPQKNIVRSWLDSLAKLFGIDIENKTDDTTLDLLKTLAQRITKGEEITQEDIQPLDTFKGGQVVDNPASTLQKNQVGDFEVTYTQQESVADMIKKGLITEPKDISFIEDAAVTITSPDDMLAGEIKYKGKVIFEGEGGVFFVTKFGDVWASGKEGTANTIAKSLNRQLKENGGKAYLTLTKGTDKKLISSASGVKSTLAILDVMLDNNLISPSLFRSAVSTAVRNAGGNINLRQSAKNLKQDVNKYFTDPKTTTFEKRGFIIEDIVGELAKNLPKESRKAIISFLNGDTNKTLAKKTSATANGLVDLIARIAAEQLTKGLNVGDVYAVIEINGEVEVTQDSHPSYPFHIALKDKSNPILHLLKNRQPGSQVLVQKSGKAYAVRNVSVVEGRVKKVTEKETVTESVSKPKQRQQLSAKKSPEKLASFYRMNRKGLIDVKDVYDEAALKEWAASTGLTVERTRGDRGETTKYFLKDENGQVYRPTKQRQQVSDVLKKDMSPVEVVQIARENNFTGPAIKDYLVRVKKLSVKEANQLLKVPVDLFSAIPPAFTNVKEGMNAGIKLFENIYNKTKKWQKKNKATDADAFDYAVEQLEKTKLFKDQSDQNRKGLSTQQKEMIVGMQKGFGVRPSQGTNLKLRALKQSLKDIKRGARELKSAQSKLRNFIRRSIPRGLYTKSEVTNLISKVTNATKENLDNLIQEVVDKVTQIQVSNLETQINKILNDKYEKIESGRAKGKKITVDVNDRIKALKNDMVSDSMVAEDVVRRNLELNQEYESIMNKEEALTEGDYSRLTDIQILINLNNATLMLNTDTNKVESLSNAFNILQQVINEGREKFKDQIKADRDRYTKNKEDMYEAVTGDKIDMNDPDQIEKAKQLKGKRKRRANKRKQDRILIRAARNIKTFLKSFLQTGESLSGLMNYITKLPGDLIGGRARKLVYERINKASREYKARMLGNKKNIENKLKELFGDKKIDRKRAINKLRKPVDWSKTKNIYRNQKEVDDAQKKFDENPTRENKNNLQKVKDENTIILSESQILYQNQQYQDPANLPSFENPDNVNFGPDHKRIMDALMAEVDPKNKELADWMVQEFYPSLYEHYNKVYKKIYRTNLPWNDFYAGRIYRENNVPNPLDLLGTDLKSNNQVSAASTKVRKANDKPIVDMDMLDVMMSYITDMEWFASYAESVRDINKMFDDPLIAEAIEDNYGEGTLFLIKSSIEKIARRGINNAGRAKFINMINNMFIATRLGANPTIFLKQMTSFITFANDIGYRNYVKYSVKTLAEAKKVYKEIWDNSVYVQDRASERIQNVIESYSSYGNVPFEVGESLIMKIMMAPVKYGDMGAIFLGGSPNYLYYKAEFKKKNPNATEQEAIDYAIEKFEDDAKNTQQSSDLQDKDFYQTSDPIIRSFNMFLTTPKQYLRKEFGAFRNLYRKIKSLDRKAGQGGVVENLRQLVQYHVLMPVFFQWVALGFPLDLEDDDKEDLARAAIIGNFNALFIVGDVISMIADAAQDKPWAGTTKSLAPLNVTSEITNLYSRIQKTKDPEKKSELTQRLILRVSELALTPAAPLPLVNIVKYARNLRELGQGGTEKDFLRLFNYSQYVIEGKDPKPTKLTKEEMRLYFPDLYEQELELDRQMKELDKELGL